MKTIGLIKGFLESVDSDLAKLETLAWKLQVIEPGLIIKRYLQSDEIDPTHEWYFSNSWGVAALFNLLKNNPTMSPEIAGCIDGVKNPFLGQLPFTGWDISKFPNVKSWIFIREPYSLFKGSPVTGWGPTTVGGFIDPFTLKQDSRCQEYVQTKRDLGEQLIEPHFDLLNHPVAMDACLNLVKRFV